MICVLCQREKTIILLCGTMRRETVLKVVLSNVCFFASLVHSIITWQWFVVTITMCLHVAKSGSACLEAGRMFHMDFVGKNPQTGPDYRFHDVGLPSKLQSTVCRCLWSMVFECWPPPAEHDRPHMEHDAADQLVSHLLRFSTRNSGQ